MIAADFIFESSLDVTIEVIHDASIHACVIKTNLEIFCESKFSPDKIRPIPSVV
jgi:hypothetical protein